MSHLSSKITNTKSSSTMFAPTPILPVWIKLTNLAKKGSLGHSWLNSPHPIPLPTVAIEFPIGQQVSPPQPQHDGSICNLEQYIVKNISSQCHRLTCYSHLHTQRHMNNVQSEMVTLIPCLALYCTFPPCFIQCICVILTLTFPQTIWVYSNLIHS